jgi:hypothetical protein
LKDQNGLMEDTMSHRRTAAAVAFSTVVLALAGCADQASTSSEDSAEDATSTASSSAVDRSAAVVAHAEAYAALVEHPAFVRVQTAEPEMVPAFVDDVTRHKLSATSNGNMWTFTDVTGPCATKLSTDGTGGEIHRTTCGGVVVDAEFEQALEKALGS